MESSSSIRPQDTQVGEGRHDLVLFKCPGLDLASNYLGMVLEEHTKALDTLAKASRDVIAAKNKVAEAIVANEDAQQNVKETTDALFKIEAKITGLSTDGTEGLESIIFATELDAARTAKENAIVMESTTKVTVLEAKAVIDAAEIIKVKSMANCDAVQAEVIRAKKILEATDRCCKKMIANLKELLRKRNGELMGQVDRAIKNSGRMARSEEQPPIAVSVVRGQKRPAPDDPSSVNDSKLKVPSI